MVTVQIITRTLVYDWLHCTFLQKTPRRIRSSCCVRLSSERKESCNDTDPLYVSWQRCWKVVDSYFGRVLPVLVPLVSVHLRLRNPWPVLERIVIGRTTHSIVQRKDKFGQTRPKEKSTGVVVRLTISHFDRWCVGRSSPHYSIPWRFRDIKETVSGSVTTVYCIWWFWR